jgi:hypothetical protein
MWFDKVINSSPSYKSMARRSDFAEANERERVIGVRDPSGMCEGNGGLVEAGNRGSYFAPF